MHQLECNDVNNITVKMALLLFIPLNDIYLTKQSVI